MGKLTVDDSRKHEKNDDTSELKTLIDKCNVCHSNLSVSECGAQFSIRQHDSGEI